MLMLFLNTQAARDATADLARSALPGAPQRLERDRPERSWPGRPRTIRRDAGQGRAPR
jgi:hypothetical protein